jgi:hypothetical protein
MVTLIVLTHFTFVPPLCLEHSKKLSNIKQVISNNYYRRHLVDLILKKFIQSSLHRSFYYLLQLNQSQQTYQPNAHPPTNTQSPNTTSIYTKHPNNTHHRLHQNSSYNNTFQQHIQHPHSIMQPNPHAAYTISTHFSIKNSSCSPNKNPQPHAALGMQLFPTTFLSKTAHAAQQNSPPSVCSYFQRLFYQKQLMQPNKNPHPRYAAISNDFSIKNSSCSPTKSPPSVCSYFQRLFYQKQLMQPNKNPRKCKNHHQHHATNITINIHPPNITPPPPPSPHHHHLPPTYLPPHLTTCSSYTPPAHTPPTKHPHKHTLH